MDCDSTGKDFLSKFVIKGKPVYAKILWRNTQENLFHIQLFKEELTWSGAFSYDMCKTFGQHIFDENYEQYLNNVEDALKMKSNMYTYDFSPLDDNSNIAKFYWKRTFVDSSATFIHGFVTVEKDRTAGTKTEIIDFLIDDNKNLSVTIEKYKEEMKRLHTDLEKWKSEFEKLIETKNSLETTLYGKFVQVLNAKKLRIQALKHQLDDL